MYYVKFCRAPSQLWVGCTTYKNGTYFASGNTLDKMMQAMKNRLYTVDRVPFSSVVLESKPCLHSEMPLQYMKKAFKTRFWNPKGYEPQDSREIMEKEMTENKVIVEKPQKQKYDKYIHKVENGILIVYGFVKVAEYPLAKTESNDEM